MGKAMIDGALPPRWGVKQPVAGGSRVLWFGQKSIALDDIQSIDAGETRERPVAGLVMGAGLFVLISIIFLLAVFEFDSRQRYLLGATFLGFLGAASFYDSMTIKTQRFFEVKFATRSQGIVTFASADATEVHALLGALAAAGVKA